MGIPLNLGTENSIFVSKELKVNEVVLTGKQILMLVGCDVDLYDLFIVHGQQSEKILPSQSVEIEDGLHFNAVLKRTDQVIGYDVITSIDSMLHTSG